MDGTGRPKVSRLSRNIGWTAVSAVTESALSAAIGIACARFMGNGAYGTLSTAIAISGIFRRLITGGLGPPSIREMAKAANSGQDSLPVWEASARAAIKKNALIWVPTTLIAAALLPTDMGLALALCAPALVATFADAKSWRLQATLEKRDEIVPDRVGQLAGGLARLGLIAAAAPGWAFASGQAVIDWTRALLLKTPGPKGQPDPEKVELLRKDSKKLLGAALTKYSVATAPLLILAAISTSAAGDFWAATRIAAVATMPTAFYFPSANAEVLQGINQKTHILRALAAALVAGSILVLGGPTIMRMLYGAEFAAAGICASILGFGIMAAGPAALMESALIGKGREACVSRAAWLAGATGAAAALLAWAGNPTPTGAAAAASLAAAVPQIMGAVLCTAMILGDKKLRMRANKTG